MPVSVSVRMNAKKYLEHAASKDHNLQYLLGTRYVRIRYHVIPVEDGYAEPNRSLYFGHAEPY